jgi:hypothetical protein
MCARDVRACVCGVCVCAVVCVCATTIGCVRKLIALLCGLMLFAADAVAAVPVQALEPCE